MVQATPDLRLGATDFARFRDLVSEKSGLELGDVRRASLERAVAQAVLDTESGNPEVLYQLLIDGQDGRAALETFIASLTIGETHFFRNRPQFEALRDHILPEVIEARRSVRRLRVWSAGCASGEEPYSIAMLLHELVPDIASWSVTVLATDINPRAMEKARRGVYGRWSFREVPAEIEHAYFRRVGSERELTPQIREMVTFRYLNLVEDVYPSLLTNTVEMDLILCRNVLIYFREVTIGRVVERLHHALARDGWLLVGHAEPSQTIADPWFRVQNFPGTVAYRRNDTPPPGPGAPAPSWPRGSGVEAPSTALADRRDVPASRRVAPKAEPWFTAEPPAPATPSGDDSLEGLKAQAEADPRDAVAAYRVAKSLASRVELDAAEHWVTAAITRDPMLAPAHYLYGLILQERGLLDAALVALRRCIYADARFELGHFALGTLLRSRGQTARALKELENVTALLRNREHGELISEGDGLTVGRLAELVGLHRQFLTSCAR